MARRKQPQHNNSSVQSPPERYSVQETENRWKHVFNGMNMSGLTGLNINGLPYGLGGFGNNPFIANARVRNLSSQPRLTERENIEQAIQDPGNNEQLLRDNTHSILYQTYPLYKLQYLYEGILSYKHYAYPKYVSKEEMSTMRFKSDSKFVDMWLKKLNPQKTFRRIVAQILAEGKKPYVIRQYYNSTTGKEDVGYVMLQEIPSDWFKITSIQKDSYYGISFNFFYFMTPGTDIRQFPDFFQEIYKELTGYGTIKPNGTITINPKEVAKSDRIAVEYDSTLDTWAYWVELPANLVWTFCFTEADALAVSPFISLLLMGSDLTNYNLLQQQLVSVPLNSLILGEMVTDTDTKHTGWSQDNFFISPEAMTLFENSINAVLGNSNIAYKMTPSVKNEMFTIPSVPNAQNIYNEAIKGLSNTAGSTALFSLSEKPSVAQTNVAKILEGRFIDRVYSQFEHFVNTIFEQMYDSGDLKFRWHFKIFGNSLTDENEINALEKALTLGQVELFPKYLAYRDLSLCDASCLADYVESSDMYDKMMPLVNSYTMNSVLDSVPNKKTDNDKGGRPEIQNPENDNTDLSKNLGASQERTKT